jgi:hypothetical protein
MYYILYMGIDPQCFVFRSTMIYLSPLLCFKFLGVVHLYNVPDFGQVKYSGQFLYMMFIRVCIDMFTPLTFRFYIRFY